MKFIKDHTGWQRVLIIIIPYFLAIGLFQVIGFVVTGADIMTMDRTELHSIPSHTAIVEFFSLLGTLLVIWLFVATIDRVKFVSIGFKLKDRAGDLVKGMLLGVAIIGFGFTALLTFRNIHIESAQFIATDFLLSMAIFAMVSVSEEVLVRGYVLRNLMVSFNRYVALGLSSFFFALLHLANPNLTLVAFTNLFLAGLLLGITYIHTKNLWFPIGLHFTWNLVQTHLGFNVSGLESYSIVKISTSANNLLSGGEFGFEGSLLCMIFLIISIVIIGIMYAKREVLEQEKLLESFAQES